MSTDESEKKSKLEALLDAAVDSIVSIDRHGIIQSANKSAELLFGHAIDEMIGRNISILMPEPWASQHDEYLRRYLETGEKRIIGKGREAEGLKKNGSTFPIHLTVTEFWAEDGVYFCGIIHDLTARKNTERALERSQRLEAAGQLTGGVAHDFNNLLTVITGNLELLELNIDAPEQRALLEEAQAAAEMGADLTSQLLAFASRSVLQPEVVDVNRIVRDLTSMLKRTLDGNIELQTVLFSDLWTTRIDPGKFENALLNLAINSRDAMPDLGSLIIETSNVVIDAPYSAIEVGVEAGDYVRISVSDAGSGMADTTLQRAFEPFFTTKPAGQGTGLGLSMVYGFAKQSGGNVTIYSEESIGTTVNIYLPRHEVEDETTRIERSSLPDDELQGSGELVLVVEDDPRVCRLTLERLKLLNYRTLAAQNGGEALEILGRTDGIDLVFTDLAMPGGISGYDVADHVHRNHPGIAVLLTSGYAEDLMNAQRLGSHSIQLLRKPYKQIDLARLLRDVLETHRRGG
ncbi:MAG: PAS domain S-box protein [Alphaproteobacteria bacterium]|nr:PAS domain S-box protein [Alphaproteobacteria bacterium]